MQAVSFNAWIVQDLHQLLFELLSDCVAKFLPLLQCTGIKLKAIGHL